MKTILPSAITTIDEAKAFLFELNKNGEEFHPEDDATDLNNDPFTEEEGKQLNKLMADIYRLDGNESHLNMVFDPCCYLLMLDPDYRQRIKEEAPEEYKEDCLKYGFPV